MPKLMIRFINIFFLIIVSFRLVAPETVWLGSGSTTPVERLPLTNIEGEFPEFSRAEQSIQNKEIFSPAEVLDSLEVRVVVPPGRAFAVVIDPSIPCFEVQYPELGLSPSGSLAVAAAPEWLKEDLALQLPHFGTLQDVMAEEILSAPDNLLDEIAFVIAHLPTEAVTDSRFDPELVSENAEWIYLIAESLLFVELVEDNTPGDQKTTTRYRCINAPGASDTVWMEIPYEVYYWWVVHPVLTDEAVKKRDEAGDDQQQTYGYFWREYLWSDPDPSHSYTEGGYPLLSSVMKSCVYLWDRNDSMLTGMRDFDPGNQSALDVLGNWTFRVVPNSPVSPRPIQPNQIAYRHGGNCGEIQDLFMAAGRTCLIPSPGTVNHLEDHVWNEYYDDFYNFPGDTLGWGDYPPAQVNRWDYDGHTYLAPQWAGYDRQRGSSKDLSFVWNYHGDGSLFNRINCYSSCCSLHVYVRDEYFNPVDGAIVQLYSDSPGGEPGYVYLGAVAVTGADGWASFAGGESNPYYARASSSIGTYPTSSVVGLTSGAAAGANYSTAITLPGTMPWLDVYLAEEPAETTEYSVIMEWIVESEIVRGPNSFTSQNLTCNQKRPGGRLTSFLMDSLQAANWEAGNPFSVWHFKKRVEGDTAWFNIPSVGKYTYVLSNQEGLCNDQIANLKLWIVRGMTAIKESTILPSDLNLRCYPNPFNCSVNIRFDTEGAFEKIRPSEIGIYDLNGRIVEVLYIPGPQGNDNIPITFKWSPEKSQPAGIYFVRLNFGSQDHRIKLLYLK